MPSRMRKKKFKKAASAVRSDDVDALKDVLDVLPQFNTMVDHDGQNLLTLSCILVSKKVFDYLLNLDCFDLDTVDYFGHSALHVAMDNIPTDYFSVKLINAGTDVFKICPDEKTYLHLATDHCLLETAKLLLQNGVDPNAQDCDGCTSLLTLLSRNSPKVDEGMDLLLQNGADTAIYDVDGYLPFDCAVIYNRKKLSVQEHLFYCTFDSHSADYEMQSDVLTTLLDAPHYDNVSSLLDNVMDVVADVILERNCKIDFFTMPPNLLEKIVEKYDFIIKKAFSTMELDHNRPMNINNIEILINSELHFETVELISRLRLWQIYSDNYCTQEEKSLLIFYLLSYGLNVTSDDCEKMYEFQDHSDLFKTMLLHLNYLDPSSQDVAPMVRIIIDIHCDLNTILASFDRFSYSKIQSLFGYFANTELRLLCERTYNPYLITKVRRLPTVPSLLQLARDETRRHIVRRYNLQKTSQYYWVLRRLEIGTTYEEIISFETKLY